MHWSLRLSALLLVVSADEICQGDDSCLDEHSSLIQEAGPVKTNKRDSSKPLAGLLESARGFLTNGVTPDVLAFANETYTQLRIVISEGLVQEAIADKAWMDHTHARFTIALDQLGTDVQVVDGWRSAEAVDYTRHTTCRNEEETACAGKRQCEMLLYDLWEDWVLQEEELKEAHNRFATHFCDGNGTLESFRVMSVPLMEIYNSKKSDADGAESAYDSKVPDCDVANQALDQKSTECNNIYTELESNACAHSNAIRSTLSRFHIEWQRLHSTYQGITDLVYNQTQDRHREYRTLRTVECLLNRTSELNGRPCDESSGTADESMTHCEAFGNSVDPCEDFPRLCPEPVPPPPTPPSCCAVPAPPSTEQCLPCPTPHCDCDDGCDWEKRLTEVRDGGFLPNLPAPVFTSENPGCNSYPVCSTCQHGLNMPAVNYQLWLAAPASFALDHQLFNTQAAQYSQHYMLGDHDRLSQTEPWTLGATMDACQSNNANSNPNRGSQTGMEIPYSMHEDAEITGAVVCCSWGGLDCDSQPNGICNDASTFAEANAICQLSNLRLCAQNEISDGRCCNPQGACNYDHFAVWVSDGWIATNQWDTPADLGTNYATSSPLDALATAPPSALSTPPPTTDPLVGR